LLTGIVWSDVLSRVSDPALRAVIEGGYASEPPLRPGQMPHIAGRRYPSMAEVRWLLHAAGDARNLYAAFFLGEVEKIAGPVSLALMGSPSAPLPVAVSA
jgi:hypothetical protein